MAKPIFTWGDNFENYLSLLNDKDEAKLRAMIDRVEKTELHDSIRKKRVKKISENIYELRTQTDEHWLRGCYFQMEGTNYYITHGFNKKSNKTPIREIQKAEKIRKQILSRKSQL